MNDQIVNIRAVSKEYVIDRARRDFAHHITECPFPERTWQATEWLREMSRLQRDHVREAA